MNVSSRRSVDLGTGAADPAATKFLIMFKAAPMLAAAANFHHYRLCGLMSESSFPELLYPAPSPSVPAITVSRLGAAEEPSRGNESLGVTICRYQRQAEGTRR